jgi:hypothetical protein
MSRVSSHTYLQRNLLYKLTPMQASPRCRAES